jgi:hypothetical protein
MTPVVVPRLWPDSLVVCLGTGPSLTAADVVRVQGQHVIAINNAYQLAPWADVLYACDAKWWRWHQGAPRFPGQKYMLAPACREYPDITALRNTGRDGLEPDPRGLKTGHNSGYQAINLAVHLGARTIVLLGYDMHGDHYFGRHPDGTKPPFTRCLAAFATLVEPLRMLGVDVLNCSRQTALRAFPLPALEDVIPC